MQHRKVTFEGADVEELYRGGRPANWQEMLKRARQAGGRRRRVSGPEAYDMEYALRLLAERGGAVPHSARECLLEMLEVLYPIITPGERPGPGQYPA